MDDLTKVLTKICNTDLSDFPDVSLNKKPMDVGLWTLWVLEEKFELYNQHFTSDEISSVLLRKGIPFESKEITRGFTKAGKYVHKSTMVDRTPMYMITTWGKEYLKKLKNVGDIQIIFTEGNTPRSDYKQFSEFMKQTKGPIKILDKFYSRDSLDVIGEFVSSRSIQFLTSQLAGNENQNKFQKELNRFKRKYSNFEIRSYPKGYELHDRYIITDDFLILIGRGLQDLGGKESFVIALKDNVVKDIKSSAISNFEDRWNKSSNLK